MAKNKPTKQELEELYLTQEMIDIFSGILQDELDRFADRLDDRPFIRKRIARLFNTAISIEEKAYFYRFSLANQLAKSNDEIKTDEVLSRTNPYLLMLIKDMRIDVKKLSQFMFLPKEGTKIDVLL